MIVNREAVAAGIDAAEALDEIILSQPEVGGDLADLCVGDMHVAGPAAAISAALALIPRPCGVKKLLVLHLNYSSGREGLRIP